MIKGCKEGHTGNLPEDNYCWLCGKKLEAIETPRCGCGHHFRREDKFCPNCGNDKIKMLKLIDDEKQKKLDLQTKARESGV